MIFMYLKKKKIWMVLKNKCSVVAWDWFERKRKSWKMVLLLLLFLCPIIKKSDYGHKLKLGLAYMCCYPFLRTNWRPNALLYSQSVMDIWRSLRNLCPNRGTGPLGRDDQWNGPSNPFHRSIGNSVDDQIRPSNQRPINK